MEILAHSNLIKISIFVLVPSMIGAAILGDFTGYAKGKWLGNKLFDKEENKLVRTLVPMLAGTSRLPLKRFAIYNVLGAVIWIGSLAPLGYVLGNEFPWLTDYSIYFLIGFVLLASAPVLFSFFKPAKANV